MKASRRDAEEEEEEEEEEWMKARKKRAHGRWSLKTRRSTRSSAGNWCQPHRIDVENGLLAERPWNRSKVDSLTSVCTTAISKEQSAREGYTARRTLACLRNSPAAAVALWQTKVDSRYWGRSHVEHY